MNTLTKRSMRLALMTVGFTGLFVAVNAVPGAATPPSENPKFLSTPLGHGKLSHGSLTVKAGLEIVVVRNDVPPGAFSGWHSHPGGAIVVVEKGQITTYRSVRNDQAEEGGTGNEDRSSNSHNSHCVITTYTAHQSFVEAPGEPLNAVNNGSTDTVSYATFPGVPVDKVTGKTLQRTDEPKPNPDPCPV